MSTPQPPSGRPTGRVGRMTSSVSRGTWRDMDQGWFMAAELLSGLFIFGGLSWWIGTRFGGHPFVFIAGSMGGFFAGFYVLYLRSEGRIGQPRDAAAVADDDTGDATAAGPGEPDRP